MTFTLAVAGKGGVGKSTFAALAVRHLHEATGEVVLAVDADPNANLGLKLGTEPGRTVGSIRESLTAKGDEPPQGVSRQELLEYEIRLALQEGDGFDLLTMGRQEGAGCYCFANNMLRTFVDGLSDQRPYVVIDNEAGLEHLSRRTTRSSDVLFVISDRSKTAMNSAKRIADLAKEMKLDIGRTVLVVNMVDSLSDPVPEAGGNGFDAVCLVRRSDFLASNALETESLLGVPTRDPAFSDVAKAVDAERRTR